MKETEIKKFEGQYLHEVFEISKEQFGKHSWELEMFRSELAAPNRLNLVLINKGRVASFLFTSISDCIEILYIATRQDEKKKGFATALLNTVANMARKDYGININLDVREGNSEAREFYKKAGFFEQGVRKKYYADGENAIRMCKDVMQKYSLNAEK